MDRAYKKAAKRTYFWLRRLLGFNQFKHLDRAVVDLAGLAELKKVFGWNLDPIVDDDAINRFEHVDDVNDRRIRDAECLAAAVRNSNLSVCVDIGTSTGRSAALMAVNAPQALIHTVNIPPEDLAKGKGGHLTTVTLTRDQIGAYYREKGLSNISQIYADTATWQPDIGTIDLAFIDGCHDADYVFGDTAMLLPHMKPGGFILWHDFNPTLVKRHAWIRQVCLGVERLYAYSLLSGHMFHVRDSWTGIYRVPEKT